jgi:hypothetical protein
MECKDNCNIATTTTMKKTLIINGTGRVIFTANLMNTSVVRVQGSNCIVRFQGASIK